MGWLLDQMRQSRQAIRKLKEVSPQSLPEYHALQAAERHFEDAKQQLLSARKTWRELGR